MDDVKLVGAVEQFRDVQAFVYLWDDSAIFFISLGQTACRVAFVCESFVANNVTSWPDWTRASVNKDATFSQGP